MKCPACQTSLVDDAKFCLKCGQQIPRCPTCGEAILTRCKFCGKAGTAVPQELQDLLPDGGSTPSAPLFSPLGEKMQLGLARGLSPLPQMSHQCATTKRHRITPVPFL